MNIRVDYMEETLEAYLRYWREEYRDQMTPDEFVGWMLTDLEQSMAAGEKIEGSESWKIDKIRKYYESEIRYYESKVRGLRERVGYWRRLAQQQAPKHECLREGYDYNYETYYKVFAVKDIPADLPVPSVLDELKENFLKEVYPFQFERLDYDEKRKCWLVRVVDQLHKDMSV